MTLLPIDCTGKITILPDAREQWDSIKDSEAEKGFFVRVHSNQATSLMRFPSRESAMSRYSGILRIQIPHIDSAESSEKKGVIGVSIAKNETPSPEWIAAAKIPSVVLMVIQEIANWLKGSKSIRAFLSESTNYARALGSQTRLLAKTKQIQTVRFVWLTLHLIVCLLENALRTGLLQETSTILMSLSTLILAIFLQNAVMISPILRDRYLLMTSGILGAVVISVLNADLLLQFHSIDK